MNTFLFFFLLIVVTLNSITVISLGFGNYSSLAKPEISPVLSFRDFNGLLYKFETFWRPHVRAQPLIPNKLY